jgi:CrcB protein
VSFVLLWLGVGVLGGAAAIGRVLVDAVVSSFTGGRFPAGTLVVNLSGSLLLGLLVGLGLHGNSYLLAGTAVLGAYTTFSTWMFESHRLAEDGEWLLLTANIFVSLVLGVGAVALGRIVGGG